MLTPNPVPKSHWEIAGTVQLRDVTNRQEERKKGNSRKEVKAEEQTNLHPTCGQQRRGETTSNRRISNTKGNRKLKYAIKMSRKKTKTGPTYGLLKKCEKHALVEEA